MAEQINNSQISQWVNSATSDDLLTVSKTIFQRVSTLDQSTQQRFQREMQQQIKGEPVN